MERMQRSSSKQTCERKVIMLALIQEMPFSMKTSSRNSDPNLRRWQPCCKSAAFMSRIGSHSFKGGRLNKCRLVDVNSDVLQTLSTLCVRGLSGIGLSQQGPIGVFRDLLGKMMEHVLQIGVQGISQDQWKWCD